MITWLVGENSFAVRRALRTIIDASAEPAEKYDAAELSLSQLPDLLMGTTLFSTARLVVIEGLASQASLWQSLPDWLPRASDQIHLVLIDAKPDKRTTSYKAVKAVAEIQEFPAWTEKDTRLAEQWLASEAGEQGVTLTPALVRHIVTRVGVDQWRLSQALEVIGLLESVTQEAIDAVVPANPQENIFQLFETALQHNPQKVHQQLQTLALEEDPYALLALLYSQALTLAALAFAGQDDNPAKDFGVHPFVASKLQRLADSLGKREVLRIIGIFADVDADMKRSRGEPWVLIEKALVDIASPRG